MELEFQIPRNDVFSSHKPKLIQNKSGVKNKFIGVRQRASGKWVAEIKNTTQKIRMWLGTFDTAEEAARAYDEAASLLRGPNTRKNFVDHLPHNSTISMKVKSLLNQKRASKQNLTFTPKNPTNKTNQKTSSQKTSCVLPNGLNKDFNVIHEELPNYNFSSLPLKPLIETNIETGSQTSSPQSYSENTSPTTSGCWNRDFQIIDDDVYRPDLRQSLDGEEKMGSSQFGLEFGDAFHQILLTNEEFLAPISDIFESETSENQFPEFDRMKVERQISASLYAMNGVNEYWQNFNNPSDSLCDLPMVYHMFCSS